MQIKIDEFQQANADFSAGLYQLENLEKEIERQEKIIQALDVEIAELSNAEQQSGEKPNSEEFIKAYKKAQEAQSKRAGIAQFIQQLQHNKQMLLLDLAEKKQHLINAYSSLLEARGEQIFDEIIAQICQPLANALLAISQSITFKNDLRQRENILRKTIDPMDFLLSQFMQKLEESGVKYLNQKDPTIAAYQINAAQLDQIPDISPIKAKQMREALKSGY
ncbi:hypothetical protein [Avibacterium sp. 20-129]|uniref:hypothetical protein n=1 Tax=Avibacterium sp. 20-129 TaxID=2911525 RepID=UPI00224804E6|nr:hypothetical protein [Avibacterium sp. 20-129]MCW9698140.1 hypothetical protein [Avibacterium sp. 20-129]